MAQHYNIQLPSQEANIILATQELENNASLSERSAAKIRHVPRKTLSDRCAGKPSRGDCQPNSKKLTKLEEEAIVRFILELDSRGFSPTRDMVRDMANNLLRERDGKPVGKNWQDNFIKRTPELKTRWSRSYHRQRSLTEDPRVIGPWFALVQSVKEKYDIQDKDIYNFDKSDFMMGVISSQLIVTSSETRGKRKKVQPGNRELVTVIQGVNATGWAIPPFIIFAGKVLISTWYQDTNIPHDWVIEVSNNGWTNNKLGVTWLKHFNKHTKVQSVGGYRLLIVDGHESHNSFEFQQLCKDLNIITLCMPPHSSHLLQPLDVVCFSLLKRAYGAEISGLARNHVNHIAKETFLPAFKAPFYKAFTKGNICASFKGAGLVPHNPEAVLSKLDLRLRTPTPTIHEDTIWTPKTPSNAHEIIAQSALIRDRIQRHQDSSPSSIIQSLNQLEKGSTRVMHDMVLIRKEITSLRTITEATTKRKSRKRKYIKSQESLTAGEVADLIAEENSGQKQGEESRKRVRVDRHCSRCNKTGHNSRTCLAEILDVEDSESCEEY